MAQPRRILVVCQHFWPETFRVNDICDYLIEQGCEVDVLCGLPNYPKGKFFKGYSYFKNRTQEHNGVKIRRAFEIPRGNNSNFRIFINYVSFPIASLFHVPRLLTKKYDKIVLYQLSPVLMSIAGILVGKIKRIETTMYVLDLWPENLFSVLKVRNTWVRKLAAVVSTWHYRHVDKLVVLSSRMQDRLQVITNFAPGRIMVLPQACEKIYEVKVRDDDLEARFNQGFNILFAGNISPAQSFQTVIEAAKELEHRKLTDINWIIVGDGMSREWLEKEIKMAGLEKRFFFEGFKPIAEVPKYTGVADLLIGCLVKSELLEATIPAKVMSYFASGKPMVLAMDGEVQELVNNTIKCGLAGPTEDAVKLADNIAKIHAMPKTEREQMGQRGQDYHFKHFERNMSMAKLFAFIFD